MRALADDPAVRFDYYCWDLYARVTEWYGADKARLDTRSRALHAIEHGGNELAEMGAFIADRIVRCHLATMARLKVDYDLLTWEGDILRLHFWATAFEQLKARGAVFLQTEGRLKGCWVMPIEEDGQRLPRRRGPSNQLRRSPTKPNSARKSSFDRTGPSRTSARTSPISSGSSACSAAISTIACSSRIATVVRCGRRRPPRRPRTACRRSGARRPSTT